MAASTSSKVAALANFYQQQDTSVGQDVPPVRGQNCPPAVGGQTEDGRGSGARYFKNSVNIRRTSSQVARFSSAKKIFEMKDKCLNSSNVEPPVTRSESPASTDEASSFSQTLPARLCSNSPLVRLGSKNSKIPIGDFWLEKKERKISSSSQSQSEVSEGRGDKENIPMEACTKRKVGKPVKPHHIQKYEALTDTVELESPVLSKAESQFSGLTESLLSPEYKKAELDFDKIAEANISTDNILDDGGDTSMEGGGRDATVTESDRNCPAAEKSVEEEERSTEVSSGCFDHDSSTSNAAASKSNKRLQSTPKDSKTKSQERNNGDLSRTRESFNGFELTSEVVLDKTSENSVNATTNKDHLAAEAETSRMVNASSLGSSLQGQSVSSWLGTSANTTNEGILKTDTEDIIDDKCASLGKNAKLLAPVDVTDRQEKAESSDYVSGDSCDLVSPLPSSLPPDSVKEESIEIIRKETDVVEIIDDVKVHFYEDGNFWYDGSPLAIIDDEEGFGVFEHMKSSKVRFSTSPIKHFSTFSNEDYDRRNEDVDPAGATAEYELEKRLAQMKVAAVELTKDPAGGLGISVLGVGVGPASDTCTDKLGIFIKAVTKGSPADKDGRIKVKISNLQYILFSS